MSATLKMPSVKSSAADGATFPFAVMASFIGVINRGAVRLIQVFTGYRNRRHVARLGELDDYLLRDIGLRRCDLYSVSHCERTQDPTRLLTMVASKYHRERMMRKSS